MNIADEDLVRIMFSTKQNNTSLEGENAYQRNMEKIIKDYMPDLKGSLKTFKSISTKNGDTRTNFDVLTKVPKVLQQQLLRDLNNADSLAGADLYGKTEGSSDDLLDLANKTHDISLEQLKFKNHSATIRNPKYRNTFMNEIRKAGGIITGNPYGDSDRVNYSLPAKENEEGELIDSNSYLKRNNRKANAAWDKRERDKTNKALQRQADAARKKEEREAQRNENNQAKKEKRDELIKERQAVANKIKLLSVVTSIAMVLKSILNTMVSLAFESMEKGRETVNEVRASHDLGMSWGTAKSRQYLAQAKGLDKNVFIDAAASLQKAFGNIDQLDDKTLAKYAVGTQGKYISDAIRSGLGQSDPNALMENILSSALQDVLKGVNHLGMNVGQSQARMDWVTYMGGINGSMGEIISSMVETAFKNTEVTDFKSYEESPLIVKIDYSAIESGAFAEFGKVANEANTVLTQIKDQLLYGILENIQSILEFIRGLNIGLNPEASVELINKAWTENNKSLISYTKENMLAEMELDVQTEKFTKGKYKTFDKYQRAVGSKVAEKSISGSNNLELVNALVRYQTSGEHIDRLEKLLKSDNNTTIDDYNSDTYLLELKRKLSNYKATVIRKTWRGNATESEEDYFWALMSGHLENAMLGESSIFNISGRSPKDLRGEAEDVFGNRTPWSEMSLKSQKLAANAIFTKNISSLLELQQMARENIPSSMLKKVAQDKANLDFSWNTKDDIITIVLTNEAGEKLIDPVEVPVSLDVAKDLDRSDYVAKSEGVN